MIITWIHIYSTFYGVDPYLSEAIVMQESNYNAKATGLLKEVGLMQIRREYLKFPDEYYNPRLNLFVGIRRLSKLKRLQPRLGKYWFCAWNLGATGALTLKRRMKLSKFKYCKEVMTKYTTLKMKNLKRSKFVTRSY